MAREMIAMPATAMAMMAMETTRAINDGDGNEGNGNEGEGNDSNRRR